MTRWHPNFQSSWPSQRRTLATDLQWALLSFTISRPKYVNDVSHDTIYVTRLCRWTWLPEDVNRRTHVQFPSVTLHSRTKSAPGARLRMFGPNFIMPFIRCVTSLAFLSLFVHCNKIRRASRTGRTRLIKMSSPPRPQHGGRTMEQWNQSSLL